MEVNYKIYLDRENNQEHVALLKMSTQELEALGWMLEDYKAILDQAGKPVADYEAYRNVLEVVENAHNVIIMARDSVKEFRPGYDKQWDPDRLRVKPETLTKQ